MAEDKLAVRTISDGTRCVVFAFSPAYSPVSDDCHTLRTHSGGGLYEPEFKLVQPSESYCGSRAEIIDEPECIGQK